MIRSIRDARSRLRSATTDGRDALITLQAEALGRAGHLIDRSPQVRGLTRLSSAARRLVEHRLDRLTAVEVEGWDALNAKKAIRTVKDLDDRGLLLAVRRREAATKDRKTVLAAIDDRLADLVAVAKAA